MLLKLVRFGSCGKDERHPAAGEGVHAERGAAVGGPGHRACVLLGAGLADGHRRG